MNIANLMDNPRLREKMGTYGRLRMEEQLAWHHQGKNLLRVYANLGNEVDPNNQEVKRQTAIANQ